MIGLRASITERLDKIASKLERAGRLDLALAVDKISDNLFPSKAIQISKGNMPEDLEKFDLERASDGLKPASGLTVKDFGFTPSGTFVAAKPVLIKDFPVLFVKNRGWINAYTIAPEGTPGNYPHQATYHEGNVIGVDTADLYTSGGDSDDYDEMYKKAKNMITSIINDLKGK